MSFSPEFITAGRLGGYVRGGDQATQFPDLWEWLIKGVGVKSVLDVGCADGQAVDFFRKRGVNALGIDGVEQDSPYIAQWDYHRGPYPGLIEQFDLIWSCEFVEHVEERHMPNFLDTFAHGKLVLMTHADPGQESGWHHVNCQSDDYWKGALASIGYEFAPDLTRSSHLLAARNTSPANHFVRSGLAFRRR